MGIVGQHSKARGKAAIGHRGPSIQAEAGPRAIPVGVPQARDYIHHFFVLARCKDMIAELEY